MTDIEALAYRLGNGTHSVWDRMQAAAVLRAVPALIDAAEHVLCPYPPCEDCNTVRAAVAAITKATS